MSDPNLSLENFNGRARLFPLPNLVLFPHVMQPLHIFEPRYRQMTADALEDDKLIAMVLLQSASEHEYTHVPPIHSVACLGRIIAEQKLDDGRYNLLLRGLSRVRIVEELDSDNPYRSARVELLEDVVMSDAAAEGEYRQKLLDLAPRVFPQPGKVKEEFRKLLMGAMPLGVLSDIVSFALPFPPDFKQEMLEDLDVESRLARLLARLESIAPPPSIASERKFPPDFSEN